MIESGFGESISRQTSSPSSSSSNNDSSNAEIFECNICFDLAQDPIVTLCGHLFCWPCLYKWLHVYSRSLECPVCKALIEEEKLVPLYGRGKNSTDPWSKSIPGMEIPDRPIGQRPETASPPDLMPMLLQNMVLDLCDGLYTSAGSHLWLLVGIVPLS